MLRVKAVAQAVAQVAQAASPAARPRGRVGGWAWLTRHAILGDKRVMPDTTAQIETRIREFVDKMHLLIRQVAIDAVASVSGGIAPPRRGPGRPPQASSVRATTAPSKLRHAVGGRRPSAVVAKTIGRVRDYIVANPGKGAEQIAPALRVTTAQLALPIKKLLASKHITRKGVRRATRYFPGPSASHAVPAPSPGGRPPKK